jgi:hypothetical protein
MIDALPNGFYDIEFSTWAATRTALLEVHDGRLSGETWNGTKFSGNFTLHPVRNLIVFEVGVHILPFSQTLTGMTAGENGRTVIFRGEMAPGPEPKRFSVDFAGRALDISMIFRGPAKPATSP